MGREIFPGGDASRMPPLSAPVAVYDKQARQYDQVYRQGRSAFQSEYALDAHGHEIIRHTEKLAYGVGAGENGYSFIVDRGGFLFQAPLSFYSRAGKWDLSPGHELGFNRPIVTGCIVCHSGRPRPVAHRDGLYGRPPFAELAIGCENCHGPGALHVRQRRQGLPVPRGGDPTMVNPARLPGWLADNICAFCHQMGDAAVLAPGKSFLDFRPGTPLDRTLAIFTLPLKGKTKVSPLLGHYELMLLSRCYRASQGKLSCISCHDPHRQASPGETPAYFRSKCLGCHQESSCTVPPAEREAQSPPDNCIACHMPRRELTSIAHAALTDHRIVRTRDEPFPKDVLVPRTGTDGLVLLDGEPGKDAPPSRLVLFCAYAQLVNAHPEYKGRLAGLIRGLAPQEQDNPVVLGTLARFSLEQGGAQGYETAITALERAVQLGTAWPQDYQLLADLLRSTGHAADAISILDRGIALDPYVNSFYMTLAACYRDEGDTRHARQILKEGLSLFPEDMSIRHALEEAQHRAGHTPG